MDICICDNCGKGILRHHCEIKRAKNHFCCKECEVEYRKKNYTHKKRKTNKIIISDTYAIIMIDNKECLIDKEDIERLSQYYWSHKFDKRHPNHQGYIETKINKKRVFIHRFITNCPSNKIIDHINGNTFDNRKINLRFCTQEYNKKNRRFSKNIYYNKRDDLYIVQFTINHKSKYVCYTRDYKEAEKYAIWARKLITENKIDELLAIPCKCILHSYHRQNNV